MKNYYLLSPPGYAVFSVGSATLWYSNLECEAQVSLPHIAQYNICSKHGICIRHQQFFEISIIHAQLYFLHFSQVKGLQGNIGYLDARTGSFNTPLFWCKLFGCDSLLRGYQNSCWSESILHSFSKILKICIFSGVLSFCAQKCLFKQFSFGCHLQSLSKSKVWHPLYNMSHSKLLLCCDCLLMYW